MKENTSLFVRVSSAYGDILDRREGGYWVGRYKGFLWKVGEKCDVYVDKGEGKGWERVKLRLNLRTGTWIMSVKLEGKYCSLGLVKLIGVVCYGVDEESYDDKFVGRLESGGLSIVEERDLAVEFVTIYDKKSVRDGNIKNAGLRRKNRVGKVVRRGVYGRESFMKLKYDWGVLGMLYQYLGVLSIREIYRMYYSVREVNLGGYLIMSRALRGEGVYKECPYRNDWLRNIRCANAVNGWSVKVYPFESTRDIVSKWLWKTNTEMEYEWYCRRSLGRKSWRRGRKTYMEFVRDEYGIGMSDVVGFERERFKVGAEKLIRWMKGNLDAICDGSNGYAEGVFDFEDFCRVLRKCSSVEEFCGKYCSFREEMVGYYDGEFREKLGLWKLERKRVMEEGFLWKGMIRVWTWREMYNDYLIRKERKGLLLKEEGVSARDVSDGSVCWNSVDDMSDWEVYCLGEFCGWMEDDVIGGGGIPYWSEVRDKWMQEEPDWGLFEEVGYSSAEEYRENYCQPFAGTSILEGRRMLKDWLG